VKRILTTPISILALAFSASNAVADGHLCWEGKTVSDGKLTIATGNPAYYPWVIDDAPQDGKGFEAAVAWAVAEEMKVPAQSVVWTRAGFDESIQPGAKNFDFNLQQFSVTEDREKVVDFSAPYYSAAMAVLTTKAVVDGGATASLEALKGLKWGADANTTAVPMLAGLIGPDSDPLLYNDNTDVTAAIQANQIDAALFDLPTALYLAAVVVEGGVVLGQFPADRTENPDQFGMLMEEGNPLKECVDAAIGALIASGKLAEIEAEWLAEATGVPVIE